MSGSRTITDQVPYHTIDGITLLAELIRPEPLPAAPMPAIIYIHGGAWRMGDRTDNRSAFLAEQGFFTVSIDYRLSQQAIFPAQIEDAKAAVRWLRSQAAQYKVDPLRIGVWGHSAGAHLASLLGTTGHLDSLADPGLKLEPSSRVQAVVALSGPSDFLEMGGWHEDADSPEAQLVGGQIRERLDMVRQANPITYARADAPPFLLVHGQQDKIVPINQSELLAQALQASGNNVTFVAIPAAGHNFGANEPSWAEAQRLTLAFFEQHLR